MHAHEAVSNHNTSHTSRREFIDRLALGTVALGGLSLGLGALPTPLGASDAPAGATATARALGASHTPLAGAAPADWDVSWHERLTGRIRTVFDVPEVESGYGVWRASIWAKQYEGVLGTPVGEMSTALVLRHNAIVLAMRQSFWDRYGIGKAKHVTHPATLEATDRNPVLLSSSRHEVPAAYDEFALDRFIARGGVVLACDLALRDCVALIMQEEKLDAEEAHQRAVAMMVPGVILQPSGIFAVLRAQQVGALYVRAS